MRGDEDAARGKEGLVWERSQIQIRCSDTCSQVPRPAQRPRVDEVHGAAVTSPSTRVCAGEILVVTVRSVAKSVAVFERDGACVACKDNWQPSQDRGSGNYVDNLLPRKGLIDQPRAALSNPRLCIPLCSGIPWNVHIKTCLHMLRHINAHQRVPA